MVVEEEYYYGVVGIDCRRRPVAKCWELVLPGRSLLTAAAAVLVLVAVVAEDSWVVEGVVVVG